MPFSVTMRYPPPGLFLVVLISLIGFLQWQRVPKFDTTNAKIVKEDDKFEYINVSPPPSFVFGDDIFRLPSTAPYKVIRPVERGKLNSCDRSVDYQEMIIEAALLQHLRLTRRDIKVLVSRLHSLPPPPPPPRLKFRSNRNSRWRLWSPTPLTKETWRRST